LKNFAKQMINFINKIKLKQLLIN